MDVIFPRLTRFLVLWSALQLWGILHFETNFVWTPMVQVHRIKKKPFYVMYVMFRLLSRVFEVTMTNITVMM